MNDRIEPYLIIDQQKIGAGEAPYVVAELSGNHNNSLERALASIDAAARAGAHAIKLQTLDPDLITLKSDRQEFKIRGGQWSGRMLWDLYAESMLPREWHLQLFERGRDLGITMFSSPFDCSAVDFLEDIGVPAYKIASPELVDHELIEKVATTGKPMIMSTGMATYEEIQEALAVARQAGCDQIALLHCVSAYPAPANEINLATINDLKQSFDVVCGLSDHTLGNMVAIGATACGAAIIEKHFTLNRSDGGIDSSFSIEPSELEGLVTSVKDMHSAMGNPNYGPTPSEADGVKFRRSLYVVKSVDKGVALKRDDLRSVRPANGLKPKYFQQVIGRLAARDLSPGEPLDWSMIE